MLRIVHNALILAIASSPMALAHNEVEAHKICLKAKDYRNCVDVNLEEQARKSGTTLQIDNWRQVGPLLVNWSFLRSMKGNHVIPAKNKEGKPIYLAVNCRKGKINVTGSGLKWKEWSVPVKQFEYELIEKICEATGELYNSQR